MFRRQRRKVVDGLIDSGGQTGGRHVMAEDSAINDLREKSGLRNQFPHQVRNILLTLRRERFLIARAAAEGNDHNLPSLLGNPGSGEQSGAEQAATQGDPCGAAQELPAGEGQSDRLFPGG